MAQPTLCLSALLFACSSLVVPLVIFASAMLLQLLWYKLRQPVLAPLRRRSWIRRRLQLQLSFNMQFSGDNPATDNVGRRRFNLPRHFGSYCWEHAIATALVVFFSAYGAIASSAVGLLLCIDIGEQKRWVLDVRLPCPAAYLGPRTGWVAGAIALGVVLMLVSILCPAFLACVLVRQAYKGLLTGQPSASRRLVRTYAMQRGHTEDESIQHRAQDRMTAMLAFRYADYAVDYVALTAAHWKAACNSLGGVLTELRLASVLVWDCVLDLHRFLLTLAAMCVMLSELHQLLLVTIILGSYLCLVLAVQPWRSNTTWRLQVLALIILVGSCFCIMAQSVGDAGAHYTSEKYAKVLPVVVIGLNAFYSALLLVVLVVCAVREFGGLLGCRSRAASAPETAEGGAV